MNENIDILKNSFQNKCPSARLFDDFFAGKMTEDDKKYFLLHVDNCPLCAEALEGLAAFKNTLIIHKEAELLNQMIDKKTAANNSLPKSNKRLIYYSVAASIALLLLSIFIINNKNSQHLENNQQLVNQIDSITKDSNMTVSDLNEMENNEIAFNKNTTKTEKPESGEQLQTPTEDELITVNESLAEEDKKYSGQQTIADSKIVLPKQEIEKETNVVEASEESIEIKSESKKRLVGRNTTSNNKAPAVALTDSIEMVDYYVQNAQIAYNKGLIDDALDYSNKAVEINPNNKEAIYNLGIMNYNAGNYTESIPYLEKNAKLKNKYSIESKWHLALAYYELKDFENAKKWLLEVVREGKEYKNEAETLLEKIK